MPGPFSLSLRSSIVAGLVRTAVIAGCVIAGWSIRAGARPGSDRRDGSLKNTEVTRAVTVPKEVILAPVAAEPPLRLGGRSQLLVDTERLASWWNVRHVQAKLRKHQQNPLVEADEEWEETARKSWGIQLCTAIRDESDGLFKMWYQIERHTGGDVPAYAFSKDGVAWTKPHLGLVEFAGTKQNNVLCRVDPDGRRRIGGGKYLIRDNRPRPASHRFLAIGPPPFHADGSQWGAFWGIAYSADGLVWHQMPGGLRGGAGGGNPSCFWDPRLQRYVLYNRHLSEHADPQADCPRYTCRQESRDLVRWSPRQTAFHPMDERWPEVESMQVYVHEGISFGLPSMLENDVRGDAEVHLLTSRDGRRWQHPFPREAFIPKGPKGAWDDNIIWWPSLVTHGDRMLFYYGGARYRHNVNGLPPGIRQIRIGMGWVPRDRLIGLETRKQLGGRGAFLTRPFVVEGDELIVNADVRGELRVEIVQPVTEFSDSGGKGHIKHYVGAGAPLYDGYRRRDCRVIRGDKLDHRVRWQTRPIGKLRNKTVRLRFVFRDATIWAFRVAAPG